MTIRVWGAVLIIIGCGTFGFLIANAHKQEVRSLQAFIFALEQMKNELQFRLTPLPELCRHISAASRGSVAGFFTELADELEMQIKPDAQSCVKAALGKFKDISGHTRTMIELMGTSLGLFDLSGQLSSLDALRNECVQALSRLTCNQDVRIRSYQTLGLCAGAAMAILFI